LIKDILVIFPLTFGDFGSHNGSGSELFLKERSSVNEKVNSQAVLGVEKIPCWIRRPLE
jgi:hypothetical protein